MRYTKGQRWAVRRKECMFDFDFVIIGKGSKPDRKLCRVEWVHQNMGRADFEAEYQHKHIKKCAKLVK